MNKQINQTSQVRKNYAKRGSRSQKMFNFRVDLDNIHWLESQPNKGRYLNELIEADRNQNSSR